MDALVEWCSDPTAATARLGHISDWAVSGVTDLSYLIWDAYWEDGVCLSTFNENLNAWDVSQVTTFKRMFYSAKSFNQPLNAWNVGKATDMESLFDKFQNTPGATYNQPLDAWDVSQVTNMASMFKGATTFDQDINSWDTSSVTTLEKLFAGDVNNHPAFNQPLDGWDVSKVSNFKLSLIPKNIFRFHVPVKNALLMDIGKAL